MTQTATKPRRTIKATSPIRGIRAKCLDCQGSSPAVKWCPSNGVTSTECPLWPYRFGMMPRTACKRMDPRLLSPKDMPDANVEVSQCTL